MQFRVLGPLSVLRGDDEVAPAAAKARALLTYLIIHARSPVSVDALASELWHDAPGPGATNTIQTYVSQLRRLLEPGRVDRAREGVLRTVAGGYLLAAAPDSIDSERFTALVAEARRDAERQHIDLAAARLDEALRLWRSRALADVAGYAAAEREADRLNGLRLDALELRFDLGLRAGRHRQLIGELRQLVAEHPLREMFTAHLMLALYRSGRQAEALAAYRALRETLDGQLGIEPMEQLRLLHGRILRQEPALAPAGADDPVDDGGPPGPLTAGSAGTAVFGTAGASRESEDADADGNGRPATGRSRRRGWILAGVLAAAVAGAAGVRVAADGHRPGAGEPGVAVSASPPSEIVNDFPLTVWPGIGYDFDLPPGQSPDGQSFTPPDSPRYPLLDLYRTVNGPDQISGVDPTPTDAIDDSNALGPVPPDTVPQACRRLPALRGNMKLAGVRAGAKFCVRTRGGHVALATITRMPAARREPIELRLIVIKAR